MKAAVFHQAGELLRVEDLPDPVPGAGEIVMKVGRCGICGTDLHLTSEHGLTPPGSVLGHEYAGEVVALGAGVERLKIGDRITAMPMFGCGHCLACLAGDPIRCVEALPIYGGYGQFTRATERASVKLPDALSLADGALVEPLAVALHGVAMSGIFAGARVVVMGAGPIGLGVVYWARRLGAGRITVIEGTPVRAAMALRMGADTCRPPEPVGPAGLTLGGIPDPNAADIVFECVGRPGLLNQAIGFAGQRATIISLGFCFTPDTLIPAAACVKELTMRFPTGWNLHEFQVSVDALDAGAVEPRAMISDTVSLAALPVAFEALRRDPTKCKVLVDPWAT